MQCYFCGSKNIFYKRSCEGVCFCKKCFKKNIEEKVRRTISKYSMLSYADHVAVAVSGGKDSLSLLYILNKFSKKFPQSKITAITIDEGIDGYRDEAIELAKNFCEELEIDQIIFSFKELFGTTLDELVKEKISIQSECSYCGTLRRRAFDHAAKIVGADKIATAHNLDDEIQTFMLNIFHGGIERITRSASNAYFINNGFVRKIKPMCEIYEKEIALYAFLTDIKFQSIPCPYAYSSLRNDIRHMINSIDENHPGIKYTVYSSKEKFASLLKENLNDSELKICDICNSPSSSKICEACKILK
jgi:cytoplasmic tRNA 2-thiolation protein 1